MVILSFTVEELVHYWEIEVNCQPEWSIHVVWLGQKNWDFKNPLVLSGNFIGEPPNGNFHLPSPLPMMCLRSCVGIHFHLGWAAVPTSHGCCVNRLMVVRTIRKIFKSCCSRSLTRSSNCGHLWIFIRYKCCWRFLYLSNFHIWSFFDQFVKTFAFLLLLYNKVWIKHDRLKR